MTYFATPVRALVLAVALALAAQAADARGTATEQTHATTRASARTKADAAERDGTPIDGILIIVGIVGVIILLAWVSSRMGDSRPTI